MVTVACLLLLGSAVILEARRRCFLHVAWPDECIYLVGARNLTERDTLHTNFYLTYSILVRGYPHRDVHMPGYILVLAPLVRMLGAGLTAGAALNIAFFLVSILLVFAVARALLENEAQAVVAAALFTILPPFPGYVFVVYPEIVVAFVFLAALFWLVRGRGGIGHAAVAGVLYASGALFRETLLVSLPLYWVRLPRRSLVRGFLPAALATLVLVVAPLSRGRAVHPNAIYPSLVHEALHGDSPLATLAAGLWHNVSQNVRSLADADPLARAEDAVLAFLGLLALGVLVSSRFLPARARRWAMATGASLVLLAASVLLLYVVRERGGVWGGVRAFMAWAPLLLIFVTPLLARPRARWLRVVLVVTVIGVFLEVDRRQAYAFFRYKMADHEDQDRQARYAARYLDRDAPRRILGRSFLYGLEHYPVEVIWSPPRDDKELHALESALSFEFVVLHEKSTLRLSFVGNPRYFRVNRDDRGAELLIWRRLY